MYGYFLELHIEVEGKQNSFLYSWRFSSYSAPIHWLVHGHMTFNNETVSCQLPQGCENYDVKRETVHCYPQNVGRCCMWSERTVEVGVLLLLASQCVFQNLLLFLSRELFCYITNHFGPLGTVYFVSLVSQCFLRLKLRFLWNKIHCSPRDQSLSVKSSPFTLKCNTRNWSKSHSFVGLICLTVLF